MLRSTCGDVKRLIQVAECKAPFSAYHLKGEKVTVFYTEKPCPQGYPAQLEGQVSDAAAATSIIRYPEKPLPLSDLVADESKWAKSYTDFGNEVLYSNREEGALLSVVNGKVATAVYYPSEGEWRERCK